MRWDLGHCRKQFPIMFYSPDSIAYRLFLSKYKSMDQHKNYKWSWTTDQRAIVESGFKIDFNDFAILRMLVDFSSSRSCKKMDEDGVTYYYFHWTLVRDQFPVLSLNSRQAVYKRLDKLIACQAIHRHKDNQKTKSSYYKFGEGRDILVDNKSKRKLPSVNESYDKCKQELPSVNESYAESKPKLPLVSTKVTKDDNESLHNTTTNNTTTNNKDIYTPPSKIGGLNISLPQDWPIDVKKSAVEYFEYRAKLSKRDRLPTELSIEKKIKAFSKILKQHSGRIFIKAVDLSIENGWKDVRVDWLFNKHPELKTKVLVKNTEDGGTNGNEELARLFFERFCHHYRDIYEDRYMDAGNSVEMAVDKVTEDLKKLKPESGQTYLQIIPKLKKDFTNLYTKAKNDIKKL